ncbi:MAG: tetratricopeptide repeat protein [Sulfurimicrobium sp.]|nr:tetratricopeptide repeat protein [Sulfurimicrobium sp.]
MSLLMKALKKAEESQQSSHNESEPTLRELAEELSLEPTPEPAAVVRDTPVEKPAGGGAGQQDAANLFAAKEPPVGKRNRFIAVLSVVALLLFAGGGAYVYIAINKPGLLMPAPSPSLPSSATPSVPQVENHLPTVQDSAPVAVAQPEFFDARSESSDRSSPAQNTPSPARAAASEQGSAEAAPDNAIKVLRGGQSEINPDLAQGYQSLQEGRLDAATTHYQRFLQQEPRSVDALLGMAAVAARSNNFSEAGKLYFRALEVEPRNMFAQAGLLNLLGSSDPVGSEAKLKQLLAEKPAGFLHFALGNLYATQKRWPEAQQAYFQAYHLESDNPDHAFNLAVSLEQISQPKPALTYYQRALQLQRQRGADFERATVEARIAQLQKMAE